MIPFPKYIKKYKTETIHGIIEHCHEVLKKANRGGLLEATRTKLSDCENELKRRAS